MTAIAEPTRVAPEEERAEPITVAIEQCEAGMVVVLRVEGCLDADAGHALLDAATAGVHDGAARLDVDLRDLASYTAAGARALVACRDLSTALPAGLHYRTGSGPGREALLAAYADRG